MTLHGSASCGPFFFRSGESCDCVVPAAVIAEDAVKVLVFAAAAAKIAVSAADAAFAQITTLSGKR